MAACFLSLGAIVNCTHKDTVNPIINPVITRGEARLLNFDPADPNNTGKDLTKVKMDKSHGNVGWSTAYLGGLAPLTGRFDTFGLSKFIFVENKPDSIQFEAWVWLNRVNTSEPGRDRGCLQTTYGVNLGMTTEVANVAIIKSKSVVYSTTDKGYICTCDMTFKGVTAEVTAKLYYSGLLKVADANPTAVPPTPERNAMGFQLLFPINAKTVFGVSSSSIADLVNIEGNVIMRIPY